MSFSSAILPGGRLHLQHGPIDLVIGVEGDHAMAYGAAEVAFDGVLEGLVAELELLQSAWRGETPPYGAVAQRMWRAVGRHEGFVTPMAAVAGAVADHVLERMVAAVPLRRAYVNNGGDIALWLAPGERFRLAVAGLDGAGLGKVEIGAGDGISGVTTSGIGGRSLSLGIAESVTVLARDAASADAAATLIANAVDLPGHRAIRRLPACEVRPESDLGDRPVVVEVGALTGEEVEAALARGANVAGKMMGKGLISGAFLVLRGQGRVVGEGVMKLAGEAERA